jgi:hypothetical protein
MILNIVHILCTKGGMVLSIPSQLGFSGDLIFVPEACTTLMNSY